MDWFGNLILHYGGAAMLLVSFVENIGFPFPALPAFVVAGAFASRGGLSFPLLVGGAVLGSLLADSVWYLLGRWRGREVLSILCRFSLHPDVCVERAEDGFHRHQIQTILLAKFVPGINTVMPPMAGIVAMSPARFLLLDGIGSLVWSVAGLGAGWVFGVQVAERVRQANGAMGVAVAAIFAGYVAWRIGYPRYLVHRYGVPRVDAEDLHRRLGEKDLLLLDLRSDRSVAESGLTIPGALRVRPSAVPRYARTVPRDREILLFCT